MFRPRRAPERALVLKPLSIKQHSGGCLLSWCEYNLAHNHQIRVLTSDAVHTLFDTDAILPGMSREAPGSATIQLGEMPMQKRHRPDEVALVTLAVSFGSGVRLRPVQFETIREVWYFTLGLISNIARL